MLTTDQLRQELHRHAGFDGAVPRHIRDLMAADGPWDGRLWDILGVFTADRDRMAYLAGSLLPDEVATWVELWADADLSLPQVAVVLAGGVHVPDRFAALARLVLLSAALNGSDGTVRRIDGELAGGWISDQFAAAADEDLLSWARQLSG
jgi:hypothetical protein